MSDQQPRPGQATLAGALIVGGSVFVVLSAWQRISTLHTIEVQDELAKVLADPVTGDLGMTVDGLATAIRVLCLIGAGAATASAILGVQVFKRSASARIALTALSPLLFFGGLATAGFLAPMVLAGIVLLWLQPTRDWYAGRPWVQRYEERRAARLATLRPPAPRGGPVPPALPQQPGSPTPTVPPVVPHATHGRRTADAFRPPALLVACVITWITSALVVVVLGVAATWVSQNRHQVFTEVMKGQPAWIRTAQVTEADVVASVYLVVAGLIAWALAAVVLAGLAFVGQNWARITLAISTAAAALMTLLFALSAWPLLILFATLATVLRLLLRPEVARWYVERSVR